MYRAWVVSAMLRPRSVRSACTTCSAQQAPQGIPQHQQPRTVRITFRGHEVEVPRGTKLRTALLTSGLTPHSEGAVYVNCRGIGSCGTCAVEVRGDVQPAEWNPAERLRLNFPPHAAPQNQRLRLACQVTCMGDLQVVKYDKFWGEGVIPLPDLPSRPASVTPLGSLEFLLDPGVRDVKEHEQ